MTDTPQDKKMTLSTSIILDGEVIGEASLEMTTKMFEYLREREFNMCNAFEKIVGKTVNAAIKRNDRRK